MERLNSQLEQALAELLAAENRGEDMAIHIVEVLAKRTGTKRDRQYLYELLDLGYIAGRASWSDKKSSIEIHGLSSKAHSYFEDHASEEKRRKKELWSGRVWALVAALLSVGFGAILTIAIQNV